MSYSATAQEEAPNYKTGIANRFGLPSHSSRRKGMGQIEVMVQGRLRIVVVSDHDKKIPNQAAVRVKELMDQQLCYLSSEEESNQGIIFQINNKSP